MGRTVGLIFIFVVVFSGCAGPTAGTLEFTASGEDFARQGLVSKDGWEVRFDHLYATFKEIAAYQTEPPYDPQSGKQLEAMKTVEVAGPVTVDLVEGALENPAVPVAQDNGAPSGHYNAISWQLESLELVGRAHKAGDLVIFALTIDPRTRFTCGDYVGDRRKGFLMEGARAELEMTLHLDHIFGNGESSQDDALNKAALGFYPLALAAQDGQLATDLIGLRASLTAAEYQTLVEALTNLGHVGEGHCLSEPY